MDKNNQFNYTYSAPSERERREAESIRRQYETHAMEETKLSRLKKLHGTVVNTALAISLVVGIFGCLIFGLGIAMVLEWQIYLYGIIIGIVGAGIMAVAYPVYKLTLRKNKEKYGAEIIKLSDEILNSEE